MAIINPQIPSLNSSTETEDPKIVDALTVIRDEINGGLDNDNITNGADINGAKILDASITDAKLSGEFPVSRITPTTSAVAKGTDQLILFGSATDITSLSVSLAAGTWLILLSVPLLSDDSAQGNLILNEAGVVAAIVPWERNLVSQAGDLTQSPLAVAVRTPTGTTTYKGQLQVTSGTGATAKAGATLTAVRLG